MGVADHARRVTRAADVHSTLEGAERAVRSDSPTRNHADIAGRSGVQQDADHYLKRSPKAL